VSLHIAQHSRPGFCLRAVWRKTARVAKTPLISISLHLVLLPLVTAGQENVSTNEEPRAPIQVLEVGRAVEGKLTTGEERVYGLVLSNSQFLRFMIAAQNPNSNIQVAVLGSNEKVVEELSGPVCPFSLYFISADSGTYRLRVKLLQSDTSPETYKIQVDELHEASQQDKTRVAANHAWVEAYRLITQNSSESQQQAVQKYEEAISLYRSAGDRRGEAELFQALAFRSFVTRDFQAAIDFARQAKALWHGLADYGREAEELESMSMYFGRLEKTQEALDSLNEALPMLRALGEPWGLAMALTDRGDIYELLGEFQEALNDKEQALSIFRSGKWRMDYEFGVLADLGHIREEIGDPQKALDYYDQALELARSHREHGLEGRMYSVAAGAYARAGEKDKALEYYSKSLALAKGDRGDETWLKMDLGTFYIGQGEYDKALGYFDQILPYFHAEHRPALERATLYWMGVAYHKQGKWQQALGALNQALSIETFPNPLRREILREIGSVYLDSSDGPKALEYYEKSLTESRSAKDLQSEALALCGVAHAERVMQQTAGARRDIEAGLKILESVRARIAGTDSRTGYSVAAQENYQFYIDLLMQMDAARPDQGFAAAALQTSERARARGLLDMLVEAHADIHQGADPKLLDRERMLQQRLRARSEHQVQLLTRPHTPEQAEAVTTELQNLTAEYDETEAQIRASSPRYAALTQPVPLDLKQIQEQVLDSETLLLEYALGEDHSYLWAVTASELTSFTLPKRAEIEQVARHVHLLLTVRNKHPKGEREVETEARIARARAEYPAAATRLSEMILGPVGTILNHKRLLIVSDGALQYIPFAVLPVPKEEKTVGEPGQPLMVGSEIVTVPSATMLAVLRRDTAGREPAPKAVAVLADPVFDDQDPRVLTRRQVSRAPHTDGVALQKGELPIGLGRSWAEVGSAERGWQIPRLPFSRREADAIIASVPPGNGLEAVDFHASRATATNPDLAQYRIVHFATHGVLDSRTPALSGIVLSLVDQQGRPQDGFLRLWDIYNLHLPADLVVLSACQTALGKEIKGEGLVGLTRGFMYAGAARVMASLWQVDDVATAELMSQFYEGVLKKKLPPATALRLAQVNMWKQKRWRRDPYFWAAFQLQGEWK
jgi:CHAT domain-containing protein/tetratricopeptide (TPR) repeat protein